MTPQATPNSWNDIETTSWAQLDEQNRDHYAARELPSVITCAETALAVALARLDSANEINEQARTDITAEALAEAAAAVVLAADELDTLRQQYAADPVAFWREEDYLDERITRQSVLAGMH